MPHVPQPLYITEAPTTFVTKSGGGFLFDPFTLKYAIFDVSTSAKETAPVQVYPSSGKATATRISLGYFRAAYTLETTPSYGRRQVRWYCVDAEDGEERSWTTNWEVLQAGRFEEAYPLYAQVADIRAQGITSSRASDLAVQKALRAAGDMIDRITGRSFSPMPKAVSFNGNGQQILLLSEEVIALSALEVGEDEPLEEEVLVFNRHLSQRLRRPDDRNSPKLELDGNIRFWRGRDNVKLSGVFGYTDWDGSPMGRTPGEISRAAVLLALQGLDPSRAGEWRVTGDRTRDQSVTYASPTSTTRPGTPLLGAFTGNAEIDSILASYLRPPAFAAV